MGKVVDIKTAKVGVRKIEQVVEAATEVKAASDNESKSDLGNSERFVAAYRGRLLYSKALGWHEWDKKGGRWARDATDRVVELAKEVVQGIRAEAAAAQDRDRSDQLFKRYLTSCRRERIKAMIGLSESALAVTPDQLDRDPFALNCLNGTVDLKTGKLREHDPKDLITKLVPIRYDPKARAPRFEKFLDEIYHGDQKLIGFVRRAAGYSATGDVREQCIFILYGRGSNGKGTFVERCLLPIVADYGQTAHAQLLMHKRFGSGDNNSLGAVAALKGARLVAAGETGEGHRLDEELVKALTGGDTLVGKHLYHDQFSFSPSHKIWLSTNHKPEIGSQGYAIWRRIKLIPFTVKFYNRDNPTDRELLKQNPGLPVRDTKLAQALDDEREGILAWVVRGAVEWCNRGKPALREPKAVSDATSEYKDEMDVLGDFLATCCVREAGARVGRHELYERYKTWTHEVGRHHWAEIRFVRHLEEAGFQREGEYKGARIWWGLRLRDQREPPDPGISRQRGTASAVWKD